MVFSFNTALANGYHGATQIARVLTEDWVERNVYCPCCGNPVLRHFEANRPVADFVCDSCRQEYELKSKERNIGIGKKSVMKIAVLNYQTGRADILENVPDEGELKTYFIEHPIQGAMHKLGQDDDSICFIETYLEVTCGYHLSEIDWMVINGIDYKDMA